MARDLGPREKPPSKDGTVQRTAKEVEGLKDFVRETPSPGKDRVDMVINEIALRLFLRSVPMVKFRLDRVQCIT